MEYSLVSSSKGATSFFNALDGIVMKKEKSDIETLKHQNTKKTRSTVYFSESEYRMLNEIYTRRLLSKQKIDKSTLVCEAIRLLYEREGSM